MEPNRQEQLEQYKLERLENRRLQAESPAYAGYLIRIPGPTTIRDDESGQVFENWNKNIQTLCPSKWYAKVNGEWVQLRRPDGKRFRFPEEIRTECHRMALSRLGDLGNRELVEVAKLLGLPFAYNPTTECIEQTVESCSYCMSLAGEEHAESCPSAGFIVGSEKQ